MRDSDTKRIESYIHELTGVRDAAANTVTAYRRELEWFSEWLAGRGHNLKTATRDDVIAYKESIGGLSPQSVAMTLKALRSFYTLGMDAGIVNANPVPLTMKITLKHQTPKDVPTASQFLGMRAAMSGDAERSAAKRCVLEALAGTGLRLSALLTLQAHNITFGTQCFITVDADTMSCKGSTAQRVPVTPYAAKLLEERTSKLAREEVVFPFTHGQVRLLVKNAAPADLPNIVPHSLRHFYCAMMYYRNLDGGRKDVAWVRDAAGHSNIAVTDRYLTMARTITTEDAWEAWAYGTRQTGVGCASSDAAGKAVPVGSANPAGDAGELVVDAAYAGAFI